MDRPLLDPTDLQARSSEDLSGFDPIYLQTQIEDAQDIIGAEVPAAQLRLNAGTLSVSLYTKVVCDVVLRVVRNPDGYQSEAAGDANFTRNALVSSGDMWLTDRDKARLTGSMPGGMPGTIRVGRARCGPAGW